MFRHLSGTINGKMALFDKQTIWVNQYNHKDTYAEFIGEFCTCDNGKVQLHIACDGHFAVYVNDELVHFGASADYPWYKLYQKKDITRFCSKQNVIKFIVWYQGEDSQTYIRDDAGLFFEVIQNRCVLLESNCKICSRVCINYRNEYCKLITPQLGYSFYYDNTIENKEPYLPSVERKRINKLYLRKTGEVSLGARVKTCCKKNESGYLIDLGEEIVGFLDLDFVCSKEQEIRISYGEHLGTGGVSRIIGTRDFSVEFHAKEGLNQYMNPFLRLAGRYLQIECQHTMEISYIGLIPTDIRVITKKVHLGNKELQQIYDVSVNTLKKCMHEHYEDCPWREQAMYTMDSRNQMLCGYYAFKGYKYQRENLLFIAQGQRQDGLLSLCFPAGKDIPIPFFSLVYLMQVYEYVQHTKDGSVLKHVKPVLERILKAFANRVDDTGLIPNFPYPYWNFYEWSDASNNEHEITRTPDEPYVKKYDLILNCMYVHACRIYELLYEETVVDEKILLAIHRVFYDKDRKLYRLSTEGNDYSQLGNSFALLIGLGDKKLAEKIVQDKTLTPVTLSMNTFYYDALLQIGQDYRMFIIEDIRRKYGYMLEQGATTFWETEKGWQDFDGAGSLCHGWSAIPVYYLSILDDKIYV